MKRGGRIHRSTGLKSKTTPLKRGSGIKQVSKKRAVENRDRVGAMEAVLRRSGGRCEASPVMAAAGLIEARKCTVWASDGHEVLTRARGGSITDPNNIKHVCRTCHDWITDHPKEALRLGLVRSAFAPPVVAPGDRTIPRGDARWRADSPPPESETPNGL